MDEGETPDPPKEYEGILDHVEQMAESQQGSQLFLRAVTSGSLIERDRLLYYTTAEAYQEMQLYILETRLKKKALKKSIEKSKNKG